MAKKVFDESPVGPIKVENFLKDAVRPVELLR